MRRMILLALLPALLCSCAGFAPSATSPEPYPGAYATRDVEVSWRIDRRADALVVKGAVRDRFYFYLKDVDLTATLLDPSGKKIGDDGFHAFPGQMAPNETNPFSLTFPLKPGEVPAKVRFFLRYEIIEDRHADIPYFQSFEADVR